MAKIITGVLTNIGEARIKRGDIEFSDVVFQPDTGEAVSWGKVSMQREVADLLRLNEPATFYGSKFWGALYGVRPDGEAGVFKCWAANPLALLLSIGMLSIGLGGAVLILPLFIAAAGVAGICMFFDGSGARSRFQKDAKAAPRAPRAATAPAQPAPTIAPPSPIAYEAGPQGAPADTPAVMEVKLLRRGPGLLLHIFSGGILTLMSWWSDRSKIKRMDHAGFETVAGKRYAWADIRDVRRTIYTAFGADVSESFMISMNPRGWASLYPRDIANATEVMDYFARHAPQRI